MSCGWPFHHDTTCEECQVWESKHSQAVEDYLTRMEILQAARRAEQAARRKTMQAGGSAPVQPGGA